MNVSSYMKSVSIVFGMLISVLASPALTLAVNPDAVCTMEYAPVCVAHQVQCIKAPCYPVYQTYSNSCMARAADSKVIHEGECTGAETGPIKGPKGDEPTPPMLGQPYTPPASCIGWYDGCNSCGRGENGQTFCTMRACLVQGVGYCTTYASGTAPTLGADTHATSSAEGSDTSSTTVATTSMGMSWWSSTWLQDFFAQFLRAFSQFNFWNLFSVGLNP